MKYIDAEKLKAEINERLHCNGSFDECGDTAWDYDQGMVAAYNYVLSVIASLQQEQEKSKKDCNGCPHCVDRKDQYDWHFKGCFGGPYQGKFIAEIDECPLKQEQPEVDLEKEYAEFIESDPVYSKLVNDIVGKSIARHFYELGLNARKEDKK